MLCDNTQHVAVHLSRKKKQNKNNNNIDVNINVIELFKLYI